MSGWTADELARMTRADELRIAGRRADGTLRKAVIIWMVTHNNELYVRSVNGTQGGWFRGTQITHTGHISAGGVEKDVLSTDFWDYGCARRSAAARASRRERPVHRRRVD